MSTIKFYTYSNIKYIISFPISWIIHKETSGPVNCIGCKKNGMVNEIFICYCTRCLLYIYNGNRGDPLYLNLTIINSIMDIESYIKSYYLSINTLYDDRLDEFDKFDESDKLNIIFFNIFIYY